MKALWSLLTIISVLFPFSGNSQHFDYMEMFLLSDSLDFKSLCKYGPTDREILDNPVKNIRLDFSDLHTAYKVQDSIPGLNLFVYSDGNLGPGLVLAIVKDSIRACRISTCLPFYSNVQLNAVDLQKGIISLKYSEYGGGTGIKTSFTWMEYWRTGDEAPEPMARILTGIYESSRTSLGSQHQYASYQELYRELDYKDGMLKISGGTYVHREITDERSDSLEKKISGVNYHLTNKKFIKIDE